jgi:cold shock CspA family protein
MKTRRKALDDMREIPPIRAPVAIDGEFTPRMLVQLSFRGLEPSEKIANECRNEALKLERYFAFATSCRIVISVPHQHHQKGNLHHVHIRLAVPGSEIVVDREPSGHHQHEDLAIALREAFDTARRELEDYVRKLRRDVKLHDQAPHGEIVRLLPLERCGFIRSGDGREIYFHENSVSGGGFDELEVGDALRFHEEPGRDGPQASSVHPVRRRRRKSV